MNNSLLNDSNSCEASFIFFYVVNFQDVSYLLQFKWFFSNLWKPISCGTLSIPGSSSDWVVTSIVDSNNQSITIRDVQKKHKNRHQLRKKKHQQQQQQLVLLPTSSVLFTFSSYRLAICLEISPCMFCIRPNGKMPLDEMSDSLRSMLIHIHQSLQSQPNISHAYISILAHHAHFTHGLYQGQMTKNTPVGDILTKIKPIFDKIEKIITARYQQATEKSALFEAYSTSQQGTEFYSPSPDHARGMNGEAGDRRSPNTTAAPFDQADPQDSTDGPGHEFFSTTASAAAAAASSSAADYMCMESVCEGLNFHLNLLPERACPVAILITSGI
jgi:hypothetical protein